MVRRILRDGELEGYGYREIRELYRGARFRVLRALRGADAVVLKTVRGDLPDPAAARVRLEREHELLRRLDLPGVPRPLALLRVAGAPVLVSPDAGASNLKEWLRRRTFAPAEFLDLAIALCRVLAAVHERGLIHGDLSPLNIVVAEDGGLTVVDFDAATAGARAAAEVAPPSETSVSYTYLAPEQTGRMNRPVDQRADLYGLGATFYEMLTGAPPFAASDPIELVHAHLARAPVPPAQVNPRVPPVVSDLVCKLLAKMPEARYQTAAAVLADLAQARARLGEAGTIAPFELGAADLARELPIADTLHGREAERAALAAAWESAGAGAREVLLMTGPAGIGKSALAEDLGRAASDGRAWIAQGKFDLQPGGPPYRALAEATRQLARALVARPEPERAALAARLTEALGSLARVLIAAAPELEPVLGPLPPDLPGGGEGRSRFGLALERFIASLASPTTPVLLFIDDLQRADRASLDVLSALAAAPALTHVLILGTYRSEEAGAPASLAEIQRALAPSGTLRVLPLAGLELDAVRAFVCETLHATPARARPLADLLRRKTAGNPFFTRRLLRDLHARGLIAFDAAAGAWTWDGQAIEEVAVSENVVELLLEALRRLPDRTREILAVAACVGKKARLELIAGVLGEAPAVVAGALAPALREGLLVVAAAWLQFAHDRVEQAADSLLSATNREALHLRIGRCLLAEIKAQPNHERLFSVVDHLSRAVSLLAAPGERAELADLCLQAARHARASSAYGPALDYLQRGIALLATDGWQTHHRLAFLLHREAIECAEIVNQSAVTDELFARALANSHTLLERAELYTSRVVGSVMNLSLDDAIKWGREGMRLFGTELPVGDYRAVIAAELAAIEKNLASRSIDELVAAPPMSDPEALAQIELLSTLRLATHGREPQMHPFIQARIVNLSLVHGTAPLTPSNYVGHGTVLIALYGDFKTAHAFGRVGVALARKLGDPAEQCRALGIFSGNVDFWISPLRDALAAARAGRALGLEVGLWLWANGAGLMAVQILFHQGGELPRLLSELDAILADASKAKAQSAVYAAQVYRQAIRCLQGLTLERDAFEDGEFEKPALLAQGDTAMTFLYAVRRLEACYLFGNIAEARAQEATATKIGSRVAWGAALIVELNFYGSLTRAASARDADEPRRSEELAAIAANQRQMKIWADNAPENFGHKHLLVEAEVARLEGRVVEAAALYDQAITGAARSEFLRDQALGNELAARFYLHLGRTRIAALYLAAALRLYSQWGAKGKVDALEEEFPDHLAPELPGSSALPDPAGPALDQLTLFRAAETIAGELGKGRLVGKLTEVCLASAGAERGVFVLDENDVPVVRAVARVDQPARLEHTALPASQQVPIGVVEEVRRTGTTLVLGDACRQGEFQRDPYVARHGVRSVLALPIRRGAKLVGVLYLENNLATRAFTPDRVRLLQLLSAQIAISLESSKNFEALTREVEERKRAEAKVRFLAEAGAALTQSLDYEGTLARVARMAVPFLADWCLVDLLEDGVLRRVAAAHHDPRKERLLHEMRERQAAHGSPRYADLLASGTPRLFPELSEATIAPWVQDPEVYTLLRQIGVHSAITVPLSARGRVIGLLVLVSGTSERGYGPDDVALAQELGRRAATAIDNARLYREAQEAVQVRDDFLSVASHELRTPLTALLLSLQSLDESGEEVTDPGLRGIVSLAVRQGRRLTRLVDDLLDTVFIERGALPLHTERVDLAALVRESVARFAPQLDRAGCTLRLELADRVIGWWDPARLDQVLLNLLSNAAKFGAGEEILVRVARQGDLATLTVIDRGIGIDPARLPHVFNRFERGVSARHYGGLGLGLFICRNIVEAQNGTIAVESEPGKGASFVVSLPCSDERPAPARPAAAPAEPPAVS